MSHPNPPNTVVAAVVFIGILLLSAATLIALGIAVYQAWFTDNLGAATSWLVLGLLFLVARPLPLWIWQRSRGDRWTQWAGGAP